MSMAGKVHVEKITTQSTYLPPRLLELLYYPMVSYTILWWVRRVLILVVEPEIVECMMHRAVVPL